MSLLLVDDVEDNLFLLSELLRKGGFDKISQAHSAKEAYKVLRLDADDDTPVEFDAILMDIHMPEINGIEACRVIRSHKRLADIPIIMVTAEIDERSVQEAFEAGAADYIRKPVRKLEVLARLRSALRLKEETDRRKLREKELVERNAALEKAMSEIRTLRDFLPICAHCKKIRDVSGYWQQLEAYLSKHSDLQFSHGICDDCIGKHHPDYQRFKNQNSNKQAES
jgi:phosphoserine phosphatase RsbU/P